MFRENMLSINIQEYEQKNIIILFLISSESGSKHF